MQMIAQIAAQTLCSACILLHVHPLLGNGLVNKFLQKQIPAKQFVARLHNNSDNRRSVFNLVRTMPSAKQQNCKLVYNNKYFLKGSMPKVSSRQ
jgi:hypothetical protein